MNTLKLLLAILGLVALALAGLRTWKYMQYRARRRAAGKRAHGLDGTTVAAYILAALLLLAALLIPGKDTPAPPAGTPDETTTGETTTETTQAAPQFAPQKTASSDPANWGITWELFRDGSPISQFSRSEPISFGSPDSYFALPGIATFRGNNHRDSATYGTASVREKTLSTAWSYTTGTLPGSTWSGSGWTGQPLIVQWDAATRNAMNLHPDKKSKDGLVEVIYATLDGNIYFLDLDDGTETRPAISVGQCFKGAGALDPRGYPILYVGSGDASPDGRKPRAYIISLIDGSILYSFGDNDAQSLRTDNNNWSAFDSSPLVDADTDTLIWPGENGILYTVKLNTSYDGTKVTVSPGQVVTTRYRAQRSGSESYWLGYEPSIVAVDGCLYISENGGLFYCIDINTMELLWVQDTKDDSNCTPVFDGQALYTAPSLHWTQSADATGTVSIYKLDALTGEILWQTPYNVHTVAGVSGGVQSSPLLGKAGSSMDGLIFFTISRIPDVYTGLLVALDTETGKEVWRMDMNNYAWSSPVAVYGDDGTGYVVVCDSGGTAFFLDGATGQLLHTLSLGGLVEASPAVYEDMLVVGTRAEKILGIKIN